MKLRIDIKNIDTTEAANNFSQLLNTNKTYFLNGKWGSGKTTFLDEVSKTFKSKKCLFGKKLVTIDLWHIKDERTAITIAFSKIHPLLFWSIKVVIIFFVVVAILMTPAVNLGLSTMLPAMWFKIAGFVALFVAVWQFLKIKSDAFYARIIKFGLQNKVLILDDFDRISIDKQEEAYKLFNVLHGKLPIVFVGDFSKLAKNEDNYLQKIIDQRIELPNVLHSNNIWNDYFILLEANLKVQLSKDLKRLFTLDERNLREREHFNDLVNQEFFDKNKWNRVQVDQQLAVIYIYLFMPNEYAKILLKGRVAPSKTYQNHLNSPGKDQVHFPPGIQTNKRLSI